MWCCLAHPSVMQVCVTGYTPDQARQVLNNLEHIDTEGQMQSEDKQVNGPQSVSLETSDAQAELKLWL